MAADEDTDDPAEPVAVDPDQYNQNRRLRQIHDARTQVTQTRQRGYELLQDTTSAIREPDYHRYYAESVIEYAIELEPIAHRTDTNVLDEQLPERDGATIRDVLDTGGRVGGEYITPTESRWIKRRLDRFMASVGLGVEIDDQSDEWEI